MSLLLSFTDIPFCMVVKTAHVCSFENILCILHVHVKDGDMVIDSGTFQIFVLYSYV
jgi:hypothetical protein